MTDVYQSARIVTVTFWILAGSWHHTHLSRTEAATWGPYAGSPICKSIRSDTPDVTSSAGRVGPQAADQTHRSMFKWNELSQWATIPNPSMVVSNGYKFTCYHIQAGTYSVNTANSLDVNLYRLTREHTNGATWNRYDGVNSWSTAGGDYNPTSLGTQNWAGDPGADPGTAKVWTFSSLPDKGLILIGAQTDSIVRRKGIGNGAEGGANSKPTLEITYNPPTGSPSVIRDWAYIGFYGYLPDDTSDTARATRLDRNFFDPDDADPLVDEANMAARTGMSYGGKTWMSATSSTDKADLQSSTFYNTDVNYGVTYGFVYVKYDGAADTPIYVGAGSDDGVKLWLNGVERYTNVIGRGVAEDSDFKGPFTLKKGWNRLLIKVEEGAGGHGWYARLCNADRTYVGNCSYYTMDNTPPTNPTSCTEAGGAQNNIWQNTVDSPSFSWSGQNDPQGSNEGVSGVRGFYVYFGPDPNGTSTTFQVASTCVPGPQAEGTNYLRVKTVDYAFNGTWQTIFTFKYDTAAPVSSCSTLTTLTNAPLANIAWTASDSNGVAQVELWYKKEAGGTWMNSGMAGSGSGGIFPSWTPPAGDGTYFLRSRAIDVAENGETDLPADGDDSFDYDTTSPSCAIAKASTDPSNASIVRYDITFSESVLQFSIDDITLSGTAPGATLANFSGSGAAYTVDVTAISGSGTVSISIAAGACHDAAGNPNSAGGPETCTIDQTAPSVTVEQATGQEDPTGFLPVRFDVVFSEAVSDFDHDDVSMGGTASGVIYSVSGSGTSYLIEVTAMASLGTVIPSAAAGVAHDAVGNSNTASTSTDNSVLYAPASSPHIVSWKSERTHGSGVGPITITLAPTGNPKSESRRYGIKKILVAFDGAVQASDGNLDTGDVSVTDSSSATYTPTLVNLIDNGLTLAIEFDPGLPDQKRYTIELAGKFKALGAPYPFLEGDTDCDVRGLVGDVNNSGNINLIDVGAIKSNSRAAITSTTCVFDVNTDGNINLIDLAMTKSMYGNTAP